MKPNRPPRQVDQERVKDHQLWLMSEKNSGERMVLSGDYRGADLSGTDLSEARIKANLRGANLRGAKLNGADLEGAILWDADLVNADLTDATGLLPSTRSAGLYVLSGADLQGAKLPSNIAEFPALGSALSLCKSVGTLFLTLVAGDAVVQLMALKTTDIQLITNTGTASIPIFNTEVPTSTLFWFGPAVLLVSYLALLFYMQKLWELISSLPAVFPDGLMLDQKAYPWMATGMIGSYFPRLKGRPQSAPASERFLYIGLMYYLIPLSFIPMFCRYLAAHDWRGTTFQIVTIWLCACYWWVFVCRARAILSRNTSVLNAVRGPLTRAPMWPKLKLLLTSTGVASLCGGGAGILACNGPFSGERPSDRMAFYNKSPWSLRKIVPNILTFFEVPPFVNLRQQELSKRPQNWAETPRTDHVTSRANLRGRDLRYGDLENAFAVNGDLQGAMLAHSNLNGADLRGADLSGVNGAGASLAGTRLALADLSNANLEHAQILSTDFGGANLRAANLSHARFYQANFQGALLYGATFQDAEIDGANFSDAHLEGAESPRYDAATRQKYSAYSVGVDLSGMNLGTGNFERAHLEGVNLASAILAGANLTRARINCAILRSADLREANLNSANLEHADLRNADLRFANLSLARLNFADLRSVNMRHCVLKSSDLRGADLRQAQMTNALLAGARYDRNTQFPALFHPAAHGMVFAR